MNMFLAACAALCVSPALANVPDRATPLQSDAYVVTLEVAGTAPIKLALSRTCVDVFAQGLYDWATALTRLPADPSSLLIMPARFLKQDALACFLELDMWKANAR